MAVIERKGQFSVSMPSVARSEDGGAALSQKQQLGPAGATGESRGRSKVGRRWRIRVMQSAGTGKAECGSNDGENGKKGDGQCRRKKDGG